MGPHREAPGDLVIGEEGCDTTGGNCQSVVRFGAEGTYQMRPNKRWSRDSDSQGEKEVEYQIG
jgi:hypothetical protein